MPAREKPILMSAPMVRAILDGRKTQTRRIVAPANSSVLGYNVSAKSEMWTGLDFDGAKAHNVSIWGPDMHLAVPWKHSSEPDYSDGVTYRVRPRVEPGELLWARETFTTYRTKTKSETRKTETILKRFFDGKVGDVVTEALKLPVGSGGLKALYAADFGEWAYSPDSDLGPWKPSIHMPRWASRITLEITNVRVERLQEISEADAIAEGCEMSGDFPKEQLHKSGIGSMGWDDAVEWYSWLWEEINGVDSWDKNPWVWVIEFRKENT